MKLLILLLSLVGFSAMAGTGPATPIKTTDGKTAYCDKAEHLNITAIRPDQVTVTQQGDSVHLSFVVESLVCSQVAGAFQWTPRPILNEYSTIAPDGTQLTHKTLQASALVINSNYDIVVESALVNQPSQQVNGNVKFDKMFSRAEMDSLDKGTTVTARLQYFNRTVMETYQGAVKLNSGLYASGSYIFSFEVSRNPFNGSFQASFVTSR